MLKHLRDNEINFLTNIFNCNVNQSIIPPMWKIGRIIPPLKPKKPADEWTSYRPISLLSPLVKILESIMLALIQESIMLEENQHGLRRVWSTAIALQQITDPIKTGLNLWNVPSWSQLT